jgi:hypothetical protein
MNYLEIAEYTKKFVFDYLLNIDKNLFEMEGPSETIIGFLCHYGYQWSASIMEKIVPTEVFSKEELEILTKVENLMIKLFDKYHGIDGGWSFLKRDEYLELKGLSYEYLRLVQESKAEW